MGIVEFIRRKKLDTIKHSDKFEYILNPGQNIKDTIEQSLQDLIDVNQRSQAILRDSYNDSLIKINQIHITML